MASSGMAVGDGVVGDGACDLFCLKEKIEVNQSTVLQKERISPALRCGFHFPKAAHVHCWVVVSDVTYKSNVTVIKVKRESGQHEVHKFDIRHTRRNITTLAG